MKRSCVSILNFKFLPLCKDFNDMPKPDYRSVKLHFNQVLKPDKIEVFQKIQDAVYRTHSITRESMFFLKSHILSDPDVIIPKLSTNYLDIVLQSVCEKPITGRPSSKNKDLKELLKRSYESFKALHGDKYEQPSYKHLNTVLDYAAKSWITMIENNVKQRYVSYVERYVNYHYNKKDVLEKLKTLNLNKEERDKQKRAFVARLRKIKNAVLDVSIKREKLKLLKEDFAWVNNHIKVMLPNKKNFQEDSIFYDIQCSPLHYLLPMFHMMEEIEVKESVKEDKAKICNVFPLRKSLIPTHIRIDTTTLTQLSGYRPSDLEESKHMVWDEYFRTNKKSFKIKGYKFNHSILTDGVSCCLLFIKEELYGKKKYIEKKKKVIVERELYLEDLTKPELEKLEKRNVVGIDPNMGNLLFCVDSKNKQLRYTQSMRNVDVKKKKYEGYNHKRLVETEVEGKNIKQWEELLSRFDSKSLNEEHYKEYLQQRFHIDSVLTDFYKDEWFRKSSLQAFRNRKNSENKFMNIFKETYGSDAVVCIGDWEQSQHRKYKEPVKGKGFRKVFKQHCLEIYLIDEHKTSKQCWGCKDDEAILKKFFRRKFLNKNGEIQESGLLHGLLKCTTCKRLWNRDANSSRNQRDIGISLIDGTGRPDYLQRKHSTSSLTTT